MQVPRTLFVQPYGQIGGAERYLEDLLALLPREAVAGVVCLQDGAFPARLREQGWPVEVVPVGPRPADLVLGAVRLRPHLRRSGAQVVHANGLKGALVAGLASRAPVVWVKHDFSWDGRVGRLGALLSRRVIGVSEAVTESFPSGVRRRKVRTVHNGTALVEVDRTPARALLRSLLDAGGEAPVVTLVGRLHPVKGHLDVLAAVDRLRAEVPGVRVAFVGGVDPNNPEHAALLEVATAEREASDVVRFLGFRDDVPQLVAGSDVVVVPSGRDDRGFGKEAFPLAALEALSAGVPVVGYADGGVPELVGPCGELVPPGDVEALAAALVRLLCDPVRAAALGAGGPGRVRERFSLEAMRRGTVAVYAEAASRSA